MTVIAYDGKMLAADSLRNDGNSRLPLWVDKIRVVNRYILYGHAGAHGDVPALFRSYYENSIAISPVSAELIVLEQPEGVIANGRNWKAFYVQDNGQFTEITGQPYAIGSGGDVALGAMLAGKNAKEAVDIASSRVLTCGGPTKYVLLDNDPQVRV